MTRQEIAKIINGEFENLGRLQGTNWQEDWKEGDILVVGKDLGQCWSEPDGNFTPENDTKYMYFIGIEGKIKGHKVDYNNIEEVEAIGAEECEKEKEVLIPEGTKLRVVYAPNDVDYEIEGKYTVRVEPVED